MKNFFKREHSKNYESQYFPIMIQNFNADNVEYLNKRKVNSFFKFGDEKDFLAFRFDVLTQWIKDNERFNKDYSVRLNNVIDILSLRNEFNSFEIQKISDVEGIIFAKWRNLKQLIVDFQLNEKEYVFYRYEIDSIVKNKKNEQPLMINSDLYITTQRIVISKHLDIISIQYDQISDYQLSREGITFFLKNGISYIVLSKDVYTIYVSLQRVFKREKIYFN